MKERKVFAQVLAAFRYGREDLDMLGLAFRKDLFIASVQVYPPLNDDNPSKPLKSSDQLTQLQERLMKKLGPNAYPFYFEVIQWRSFEFQCVNLVEGIVFLLLQLQWYFQLHTALLNRS